MKIPIAKPNSELSDIKNFDSRFINEVNKGVYIGGENVASYENDLKKFQYNGYAETFKDFEKLKKVFPKKRPKGLGKHIVTSNILESSRKCLGVLDGTSHFIELYKFVAYLSVIPAIKSQTDLSFVKLRKALLFINLVGFFLIFKNKVFTIF